MNNLQLTTIDNQKLVDSRVIAQALGVTHEATYRLIKKYKRNLEVDGHLRFEIGTVRNSAGAVNKIHYALLNERQALFIGTLSSNTAKAVEFKQALTNAYQDLREKEKKLVLKTTQELTTKDILKLASDEIQRLENQVKKLTHNGKLYNATEIAKELGMRSANELNLKLEEMGIQYKSNKTWVFSAQYADKGYTSIKQLELDNGSIVYDRKFTGLGRDFLLDLFNN